MDDFQSEDELKPDTSDRPAARGKKPTPTFKLPISKQHLIIAVGILVLLLLVLGIGSALNGSSTPGQHSGQGNERNIDLSSNNSGNNQQPTPASASTSVSDQAVVEQSGADSVSSQSNTTDSNPSMPMTDNATASNANTASLPTGPATLDRNANLSHVSNPQSVVQQAPAPAVRHINPPVQHARPKVEPQHSAPRAVNRAPVERSQPAHREVAKAEKPVVKTVVEQPTKAPVAETKSSNAPLMTGKGYTLQLSSASREDTLNAWAKQQNLSGYLVYKTTRNGRPWYVLVTGSYKTSAEAKRAISSLPEAVRAKSPWVKPLSQMH